MWLRQVKGTCFTSSLKSISGCNVFLVVQNTMAQLWELWPALSLPLDQSSQWSASWMRQYPLILRSLSQSLHMCLSLFLLIPTPLGPATEAVCWRKEGRRRTIWLYRNWKKQTTTRKQKPTMNWGLLDHGLLNSYLCHYKNTIYLITMGTKKKAL